MITCTFDFGAVAHLRHVVTHALVASEGKVLLVRRAHHLLEGGKWAIPGGYLDQNETLEEGVLRELLEETGWKGTNPTLFSINANPHARHDPSQNVRISYAIEPVGKTGEKDKETLEVRWFTKEALPATDEFAFAHRETVEQFLAYRKKPFPLPLLG